MTQPERLGTLVYDELILPIFSVRLVAKGIEFSADATHLPAGTALDGVFQMFTDKGEVVFEGRPFAASCLIPDVSGKVTVTQRIEFGDWDG